MSYYATSLTRLFVLLHFELDCLTYPTYCIIGRLDVLLVRVAHKMFD